MELASSTSDLKTASALAVLAGLLLWESLAPYTDFFRGQPRARLVHAARNFTLGMGNAIFSTAALVTVWTAAAQWAATNQFGILNWTGLQGPGRWLAMLLLFDAWMYWWHRWTHRIPLLWRFHRVHHSDAHMDVSTAQRFHLGEIILSAVARTPVIALLGMTLPELVIYETLMLAVVQLQHANIGLPAALERSARIFIVTPALHKVHHSRIRAETDSNYASLFAWWDLLFKSRRTRNDPRTIALGLDGFDSPRQQSLLGLTLMPRE